MSSNREKNHNMRNSPEGDDCHRHSNSWRDRRGYQSRREAYPRKPAGLDERAQCRARQEPDRHHTRQDEVQTTQRRFYGKKESRKDDRAYAVTKSATRMRRNEPVLSSANELKTKIRDIKRLLSYAESLPADVRIEKERALVGYQRDLEIVEARRRRAAMIKKYHFVRFLGNCI